MPYLLALTMANRVLHPLLQSKPSRVVVLSSVAHMISGVDLEDLNYTKGRKYGAWSSYGQSKTADIFLARELSRRWACCVQQCNLLRSTTFIPASISSAS